jgi:hypothetical protein
MSNSNLPAHPFQPEQALRYLMSLPHLELHPNLPQVAEQLPRVETVWDGIDSEAAAMYGDRSGASERLCAGITAVGGYFEAYRAVGNMTGSAYSTFFADLLASEVHIYSLGLQHVKVSRPPQPPFVQCYFAPPTPSAAPVTPVTARHWIQFPLSNRETSPEDFLVSSGARRYYLADMPDLQEKTKLFPDKIRNCLFLPATRYEE